MINYSKAYLEWQGMRGKKIIIFVLHVILVVYYKNNKKIGNNIKYGVVYYKYNIKDG